MMRIGSTFVSNYLQAAELRRTCGANRVTLRLARHLGNDRTDVLTEFDRGTLLSHLNLEYIPDT
jgi:hypothetical protein